jgi:hypothetical protein
MTVLKANPFAKAQFCCHRDWEESLLAFLSNEAKNPDVRNWLAFCVQPEPQEAAAFSALLLSDLLETKPGFKEPSAKIYQIYRTLCRAGDGANKFEMWLRSGWLNVSRIACLLDARLKH